MKCLHCQRLDIDQHPAHANAGMGRCKLEKLPGVFESWRSERKCNHFLEATEMVKEKRIEWSEKL